MDACIFCRILNNEAPASQVYRDEYVAAFMDIQPVTSGHVLIVPLRHAAYLSDVTPEDAGRMLQLAQRVSKAMFDSGIQCEGVNLFLANGEAAGQEVFHAHLHVIPRKRGDGFGLRFPAGYGKRPSRQTLDDLAAEIRRALV